MEAADQDMSEVPYSRGTRRLESTFSSRVKQMDRGKFLELYDALVRDELETFQEKNRKSVGQEGAKLKNQSSSSPSSLGSNSG